MTLRATLWGNPGENRPQDIAIFHAFAEPPVHGQTGVLKITVRDARTDYAVRAKIEIQGAKSLTTETDENGSLKLSLPTGDDYLIQISAPGYKTMIWDALIIRPGDNASGAMLSPIKEPEKPPLLKSLEAQLRPGYTLVDGLAVNELGQPVAEVRVTLQGNGIQTVETTTDNKGYFGFLVPTPPGTPPSPEDPDGLPGTGEVIMEKPGYKTQIHHNVPLFDNSNSGVTLVEMKRGSGIDECDDAPAWMNGTVGTCIGEGACDFDKTPEHLKVKPEKANPVPPVDSPAPSVTRTAKSLQAANCLW